MEAINAKKFTLEADQVVFKYGQTAYVTSNTNFVSVDGEDAVVQVAFNIPAAGPNGLGGVTVDGKVSSYEMRTDKKGTLYLSMNVMGTGISARLDISTRQALAASRAGGMIPPSRPRQALAGHRQAETAIRPVNPAALGAGTRDAETDLRTITKNHR